MLTGISLTCIAGSYLIVFLLEASRLRLRGRIWHNSAMVAMVVGLLTHSLHLYNLASSEANQGHGVLSSWYDWCLVAAWFLAAFYLGMAMRRPETAIGIFFLPLVLAMLVGALLFRQYAPEPFPHDDARRYWRIVHGIALLMGTVSVSLGFATGLMYLIQSYRLKHKLPMRTGFQLPSLEWLHRCSQETLFVSTLLLAIGVLSGVVLNLYRSNQVAWSDPVVFSSALLFGWLTAASLFEWLYKPARVGHKVAYLTIASLVFLVMALTLALVGRHAVNNPAATPAVSAATPLAMSTTDWQRSARDGELSRFARQLSVSVGRPS
ncbi:MAG: cytochrome c biogenesis protein CcsA [Xanthomonadales bacterium]|nr:cytochrome c biogenesis protein CcsA [Planctomycetales bacterium]MCB1559637.1 cytochrome c biogenesis protein CcsA [Xanthomonadales bacterium]